MYCNLPQPWSNFDMFGGPAAEACSLKMMVECLRRTPAGCWKYGRCRGLRLNGVLFLLP